MIIFPAVDIQDGKAVRLKRGKKEDSTVFGDDPVALAKKWQEQGAEWLHIIDLDGAFAGKCANQAIIERIVSETGLPIQIGGGIRDLATAASYIDAGAKRLIIGTIALENPEEFRKMTTKWPGQIGVSLDGENGRLKSRGWVRDSGLFIADILPRLEEAGTAFIIYTDIARDGMRSGVNIQATDELLSSTDLPVIAAGGVSDLGDIERLAALEKFPNFEGVISGRAIYEGSLDLAEAIELARK